MSAQAKTTSSTDSLWSETAPETCFRPLEEACSVDVAVLGGGIAGLTVALLLKRSGARVAVIEANRVGHGVTANTTAKVSALQATIYSKIRGRHGSEAAEVYADASAAGVEQIAALAREEQIECELEQRDACTYAARPKDVEAVEAEAEAASDAGLDVTVGEVTDLPFRTEAAVSLVDQLQFHPVRFVQGLARAVEGQGSAVHEQTMALGVDAGSPCRVATSRGEVQAAQVVIATHYPLLDRGFFFARLKPQRSYCAAARVEGDIPQTMSISAGSPIRSTRSFGDLLILGGEGHQTGSREAEPERYRRLEQFAREHWPVASVPHRWSAQDPIPNDHLPIIGPYLPRSDRIYVASGFMKWGLSSAAAAAILISQTINGIESPWASTFTPNRISLRSLPELAQMNSKVGIAFVADRIRPAEAGSAEDVPPGEARVVREGLGKAGVYRDEDGALHMVSLRCTHLGCLLRFNGAERSWDCPCHGSRFDVDGAVLEGPAVRPLPSKSELIEPAE